MALNRSFTVVVHGQKTQKGCIKCMLTSKKVKNKWNAYKRNFPIIVDDRSSGSIRLFAINDYQISGDFPTLVNDLHASKLGEKGVFA